MELTAVGYILVPLSLVFIFRPATLLQLALAVSGLQAAAAIVFHMGGEPFGLSCGLVPGLLAAGMLTLDFLTRNFRDSEKQVTRIVLPLLIFSAVVFVGAMVLPRLFAGQFDVWPQNVGALDLQVALEPNAGNITQSLYVVANAFLLLMAGFFASRPGTRYMGFVKAYLISGYIAAGVVLWEYASKHTGLYYPSEFFYSNPRWAILTNQTFGDVDRINGPFTEPAALAFFFAGIVFACLRLDAIGYRSFPVRPLLFLSLVSLLLSTSTTALLVVAVAVPLLVLNMNRRERQNFIFSLTTAVAGLSMLGIVAYLTVPSVLNNLQSASAVVLNGALIDKSQSGSYEDRTTKDIDSLGVVVSSLGAGAGWGSDRGSSLVPTVLANSGIPGLVLLIWFAARTAKVTSRARRTPAPTETHAALNALSASILGTLCAALISAPTINDVDFFLRLAILIGGAVRVRLDAAARQMPARATAAASLAPIAARSLPELP